LLVAVWQFQVAWQATSLAIPGAVVTLGVAWLRRHAVARRLALPVPVAILLIVSVGAMLTLTLSPNRPLFPLQRDAWCVWPPPTLWDSVTALRTLNTRSLNALMVAPIGLACALSRSRPMVLRLVAAGAATPFAVEFLQWVLPIRRGCDAADVVDNLVGLSLGVLAGLLVRPVLLRRRRPVPVPDTA
jgi:hypothetical protein